ncbi:pectinesterase [Salix suchowensis]|nr:pectinesterase [Salix suchowensis]
MSLKLAHIAAFATTSVITVAFSGHMLMACLHKTVIDSPLLTRKIDSTRTIKFDINGADGDLTSVQEAIDAVPQNDSQWIIIHVRKLSLEKIHFPKNNPCTNWDQSVAALAVSDMAAFYHSGFYTHNTLFDYKGSLIDFIFGHGRSIFHSCEVFVITDMRVMEDDSGFVFVEGKIYGGGNACSGRAKGAYSRVVFKSLPSRTHVQEPRLAPWSKQLTAEEATSFVFNDFINGKERLPVWKIKIADAAVVVLWIPGLAFSSPVNFHKTRCQYHGESTYPTL